MRYERSLAVARRLDDLLAIIRSGAHSSPTLAKKLGASEQTTYRGIGCLKRQGHRIHSVKRSSTWGYQIVRGVAEIHQGTAGRRT